MSLTLYKNADYILYYFVPLSMIKYVIVETHDNIPY